jgi:alpha-glucuronidase
MDRTIATGTGYVGQYWPRVQDIYEPLANTPDNLVLFFHHVPYTYKLHTGKSVIQTIYDLHYEGAARAQQFVTTWQSLKGHVDDERYDVVLKQLDYQAGHSIVWRDAIDDWFHQLSGIDDAQGRVGHHPNRIEAESMQLDGYAQFVPASWEGASGGKGIVCPENQTACSAQTKFEGAAGKYEIDVEDFDLNAGVAHFKVFVGDKLVGEWAADDHLPGRTPSADSSVRRKIAGVALKPGDVVRIEGTPDSVDRAALDYIEILPATAP